MRRVHPGSGQVDGQILVIYHAEPGSESARSLALLGSLAASAAPAGPADLDQTRQAR